MAISTILKPRLLESAGGDGAAGGGERRPSPAELTANANARRLARINAVGDTADGRRAREMVDVNGERETGRFAGGEFDNSEAARERQAEIDDELARQAIDEQRERAEEADRLEEEDRARRLQGEGAAEEEPARGAPRGEGNGTARPDPAAEPGDERVIDGVRYYLTIVGGEERWLTMKELRAQAALASNAEETLHRAEAALASAAQAGLTPKGDSAEVPDEKDLENIILSATVGDEDAVRKLVSVIRGRPQGASTQEVSRLVSQQIATQREVDRAENANEDLLGNDLLAPIFRQRLAQFAAARPKTKIVDAYEQVATQMRKDFAPMLQQQQDTGRRPNGATRTPAPNASKNDRKRQLVMPPRGAGRQQTQRDDEREPSVSEDIDAIARARGQARAHRVRRS